MLCSQLQKMPCCQCLIYRITHFASGKSISALDNKREREEAIYYTNLTQAIYYTNPSEKVKKSACVTNFVTYFTVKYLDKGYNLSFSMQYTIFISLYRI